GVGDLVEELLLGGGPDALRHVLVDADGQLRPEDVVVLDRLRTAPPLVVAGDRHSLGLVPDRRVAGPVGRALELVGADDLNQAGVLDAAGQVGDGQVDALLRVEERLVDLAHGELLLVWPRTSPRRTGMCVQPNSAGSLAAAAFGSETTFTWSAPGAPVLKREAGCCTGGCTEV